MVLASNITEIEPLGYILCNNKYFKYSLQYYSMKYMT